MYPNLEQVVSVLFKRNEHKMCGAFSFNSPFAQSSRVSGDFSRLNRTELPKLSLEIRSRDLEKQVADIDTITGSNDPIWARSHTGIRTPSRTGIRITPSPVSVISLASTGRIRKPPALG